MPKRFPRMDVGQWYHDFGYDWSFFGDRDVRDWYSGRRRRLPVWHVLDCLVGGDYVPGGRVWMLVSGVAGYA